MLALFITTLANTCVEETQSQQTCSQAMHARLLTCHEAYNRGFRCCPRCDPCGFDGNLCSAPAAAVGSSSWVSPRCVCDKVIVTGACSLRGCAKPDVLGVFSRRPGWRTSDGRHVYVKDRVQPIQGLHSDAHHHQSYDDTSGSSSSNSSDSGVFLYFKSGRWLVSPRVQLDDDSYARSGLTDAPCPTNAPLWSFWWGGGVSPLSLRTSLTSGIGYYPTTPRGWVRPTRYPIKIDCWSSPPSPPPPPPKPPPPPPPPPPHPPPPVRLVPGPYTGRLEIYHTKPGQIIASRLVNRLPGSNPFATVSAWGTVCDDGFDRADATVACRQLGLGRALRYWREMAEEEDDTPNGGHDTISPPSNGPIWMENVRCGGEEAALVECGFTGWGNTDCSHSEDIHLLCAPPPRRPPPEPASRSSTAALMNLLLDEIDDDEGTTARDLMGNVVAIVGGLVLLVCGFGCVFCFVVFRCAAASEARSLPPAREVHITLQAPPAGAASEEQQQAQQQLAAALSRALEEGGEGK